MRKNSIKNTRINGEVQKVLSEIIRGEIKDPRISPLTSVVSVSVAPDLKTCKAFISVLGNEEAQENTMAGLKSAVGYVRRQLAKELNLRNISFFCRVHDRFDTLIASDISRIDTDLVCTVFHGCNGHLIIKMNICHQRNGDLLFDLF